MLILTVWICEMWKWSSYNVNFNIMNLRNVPFSFSFLLQARYPLALCGDLRFADRKNRSFKTYLFEFSQAKLSYYKDKRVSVPKNMK
jgi:hypothetical protein